MVLAFFDNRGMIYTNYVDVGTTVNADYIVDVLSRFLKAFKAKHPEKAADHWILHWDNARVHTAVKTHKFLDDKTSKPCLTRPTVRILHQQTSSSFQRSKQALQANLLAVGVSKWPGSGWWEAFPKRPSPRPTRSAMTAI